MDTERVEPCVMCANRQKCKDLRIACSLFWCYVNGQGGLRGEAPNRNPNRETYLMLFPGEQRREI